MWASLPPSVINWKIFHFFSKNAHEPTTFDKRTSAGLLRNFYAHKWGTRKRTNTQHLVYSRWGRGTYTHYPDDDGRFQSSLLFLTIRTEEEVGKNKKKWKER